MRYIYMGLGFVFLVVGIAGVILPLLPGTVNLLIATYFFAKSSPRMEAWILNHPKLGPPIVLWRTERSMTRKTKVIAITMMWMGISYSVYAAPPIGGICAVLLGIYGTYYILKQKVRVEPVAEAGGDGETVAVSTGADGVTVRDAEAVDGSAALAKSA